MTVTHTPTLNEVWDKALSDLAGAGIVNPTHEQFLQAQSEARESLTYEVEVDKSTMKFKE
jgi:hypothetical protein